MQAIVVVDENWAIGNNGGLLVHIPGDLKYFKEKTLGKTVIMGRATIESLPGKKPLPGRNTIVLTRSGTSYEGAETAGSIEECMNKIKEIPEADVFIAGGATVYEQFLPYCDACLVTKIHTGFPADTYFENLDKSDDFNLTWESEERVENNVTYHFTEYRRK